MIAFASMTATERWSCSSSMHVDFDGAGAVEAIFAHDDEGAPDILCVFRTRYFRLTPAGFTLPPFTFHLSPPHIGHLTFDRGHPRPHSNCDSFTTIQRNCQYAFDGGASRAASPEAGVLGEGEFWAFRSFKDRTVHVLPTASRCVYRS